LWNKSTAHIRTCKVTVFRANIRDYRNVVCLTCSRLTGSLSRCWQQQCAFERATAGLVFQNC
jgi:hypothetical protein